MTISLFELCKKHWGMSIMAICILAASISMIVYSVVTGEGDNGFMMGKSGKPLTWPADDMPLMCLYDVSVGAQQDEMKAAIKRIQEVVGVVVRDCEPWQIDAPFPSKPVRGAVLLKLMPPPEQSEDGSYLSSPWDVQHGGTTRLFTDTTTGALYGAIIHVNPETPKELWQRIWTHELLHALGLAHDRTRDSIMHPSASDRSNDISAGDIKRLKEAYNQ